jgi:hypothetical protein
MIRDSSRISPTIHNQSWGVKNKIKVSIDPKTKKKIKQWNKYLNRSKKPQNIIKASMGPKIQNQNKSLN